MHRVAAQTVPALTVTTDRAATMAASDALAAAIAAAVNGRWPIGAPLPTMPPDVLEALPPLPPELEYRFVRGAGIASSELPFPASVSTPRFPMPAFGACVVLVDHRFGRGSRRLKRSTASPRRHDGVRTN